MFSLSKLVTVKWVSPHMTDHELLEKLRDVGLRIPAGTHVHSGFGRVRILRFSRRSDVAYLLATKGAFLKNHKDISINPASTTRRISYSEKQAISGCNRDQRH